MSKCKRISIVYIMFALLISVLLTPELTVAGDVFEGEIVDYGEDIKTNREKLFACYALIEQLRVEHNEVVEEFQSRNVFEYDVLDCDAVVVVNADEIRSLRAKFRSYAQKSKDYLKSLLAERNRLMELIRWENYTLEEWRAVGNLSIRQQGIIYDGLFGDKSVEKVKVTEATSVVLDELKALNLEDMPEMLGFDPTEDFTTYTEVDEGDDIIVTEDRITFSNLETRSDTFYVFRDKEADHFDGDFEHLFKTELSAGSYGFLGNFWVLGNAVGDLKQLYDASESFFYARLFGYDVGPDYRFDLYEADGGSPYGDASGDVSLNTVYYLELERDEALGTYGTIYCYICTGGYWDDGGTQIDTISVELHTSKKDFRYIYGLVSYDDGAAGRTGTGYMELLDLQEAVEIPGGAGVGEGFGGWMIALLFCVVGLSWFTRSWLLGIVGVMLCIVSYVWVGGFIGSGIGVTGASAFFLIILGWIVLNLIWREAHG